MKLVQTIGICLQELTRDRQRSQQCQLQRNRIWSHFQKSTYNRQTQMQNSVTQLQFITYNKQILYKLPRQNYTINRKLPIPNQNCIISQIPYIDFPSYFNSGQAYSYLSFPLTSIIKNKLQLVILHIYQSLMFNWCCQEDMLSKDELFIYRSNNKSSNRSIIKASQLNFMLNKQESNYMIFKKSMYDELYKKCVEKDEMFYDMEFDTRIIVMEKIKGRKVTWRRLGNFVQNNESILQKKSMEQIIQLNQVDSYFLPTLAALYGTSFKNIQDIFDGDCRPNDKGIYKLNISVNGEPQQIIIDDLIPVFQDNQQKTAFSRAQNGSLWVLLLQKAYAKIQGGYQKIASGYSHHVFRTFNVAPCLYHFIPLNFSFYEQENLWNKLIEAKRNKFPTVCGSRKEFTCRGIQQNNTYPFIDCWIEKQEEHTVRKIRLANIANFIDQECEHNAIKLDGNFINIELVEFMRNFQLIDVLHTHPDYNAYFYQLKSQPPSFNFYVVDITKDVSFYITLQRSLDFKGRLRIILARCIQNSLTDYELSLSKYQELYSDTTLQCKSLPSGRYIIGCYSSIKSQSFLKIYSKSNLKFQTTKQIQLKFLQHIFFDLALRDRENMRFLTQNNDDWYYSKVMFEQLGYSFIIINLTSSSKVRCRINFKRQDIKLEGFKSLNCISTVYSKELKAADTQILIFEIANQVNNESLKFPPSSLEIKIVF